MSASQIRALVLQVWFILFAVLSFLTWGILPAGIFAVLAILLVML